MMGPQATNMLLEEAQAAFPFASYQDIRFPSINGNGEPLKVPAVWTLDNARPRWNNLAIIIGEISLSHDLALWRNVSTTFAPRLTALANQENGEQYILLTLENQREVIQQTVSSSELRQALAKKHDELFAPNTLAAIRGGQWSFADLDTLLPKDTIQFRQREKLDEALRNALTGALKAQRNAVGSTENQDAVVIEVAIAYLAARILADKGVFPQYPSVNDPKRLLQLTVEHTNGFFSHVCGDNLHLLSDETLQELAAHLGSSVTFALIDDRDVGLVYERSFAHLKALNDPRKKDRVTGLSGIEIPNLQQHYTPMAIAERMLAALPLERLRPEERVIFDPAAGSGTLLLAATKRLATMPDIQLLDEDERRRLLAHHVMGNDIDPNAWLITQLRYYLIQETLSKTFPKPVHFTTGNYEDNTTWPLSPRPRVLVANPPFAQVEGKQTAVIFLKKALEHLYEGDQFAFVLPQSFLTATRYGWKLIRKSIGDRCHILEAWQLPEGAIGLKARQPTCIVSGMVGEKKSYSMAHAIISGAGQDWIRERGFLGQAWLGTVGTEHWREVIAPVTQISSPTISLGLLFLVHNGVKLRPGKNPIAHPVGNIPVKRYWKHEWRRAKADSLWIHPELSPPDERYIRYESDYTELRIKNEAVYDSSKILIGRKTNRGSNKPLPVYYDDIGFCPESDIHCIVPIAFNKQKRLPPEFDRRTWSALTQKECMFWVLGVLSSELAANIMATYRSAGHISIENVHSFPLPTTIDQDIITLVADIIRREQRDASDAELAPLHKRLNELVEASYGHPVRPLTLIRTGELPDIQKWLSERQEKPIAVTGQVVEIDAEKNQVLLYLEGLLDDETEAWVPLPPELPGWALDGTVFSADLSETVETFEHLRERPWALRNVRHTPTPYLSLDELREELFTSVEDTT